jgi:hypothetical protein
MSGSAAALKTGLGSWTGTVPNGSMVLLLVRPEPVYAIRLTFVLTGGPDRPSAFQLSWSGGGQGTGAGGGGTFSKTLRPAAGPQTLTVWVDATVDLLRIRPDEIACCFELQEVTLLQRDSPRNEPAPRGEP